MRPVSKWAVPLLLAFAVILTYLPSLADAFLNYDDNWLIGENHIVVEGSWRAVTAIWFDLGRATRGMLGAEYLPVRDMSEWIEGRLWGLGALTMRFTNLALYVAAILFLRATLLALFEQTRELAPGPARWAGEITAWCFALHPLHVESVAWLAGRKDVLALFFVAAALFAHARDVRQRHILVPVLMVLAALSKGVAVAAPLLLPVHDLLRGRRWTVSPFLPALAGVFLVLGLHLYVGSQVHMTTTPAGGSRLAALATMGPVTARYLLHAVWPAGLSISYDRDIRQAGDLAAFAAYLPLVVWSLVAVKFWRRGQRRWAVALAWFLIPMAPTSQIVAPLENIEADRYMLIPLLGPCAIAGFALAAIVPRLRPWIAQGLSVAAVLIALCWTSAVRSRVFSDSVLLWRDASAKTTDNPVPPYQLGKALLQTGDHKRSVAAFHESLRRQPDGERAQQSLSNLSVALIQGGNMAEAERLLRLGIQRFPNNPKLLNNLAETLARTGRHEEARTLFHELVERFPSYEMGRRNLLHHYPDAASDPR